MKTAIVLFVLAVMFLTMEVGLLIHDRLTSLTL